ncbi:MAG: hypothetical protein HW421_1788 [Ignavibacteria bacterium]|nr:hypothetical protein [Ignavibacteria bacterium]
MKKFLLIFGIFASMIVLYSCKDSLGIEDNVYRTRDGKPCYSTIPLATGNYWIYETKLFDTLGNQMGNTAIDSMLVGRNLVISGRSAYEMTTYRAGKVIETGFLYCDDALWIYSKLLTPMLDTVNENCFCGLEEKWHQLTSCQSNDWFYNDNFIETNLLPSLVEDPNDPTKYKLIYSHTRWDLYYYAKVQDSNFIGGTKEFKITGNVEYSITDTNEPVQFKIDPEKGMKYKNNNRTIILQEMELSLWLDYRVGIKRILGKAFSGKMFTIQERNLIRYRLR